MQGLQQVGHITQLHHCDNKFPKATPRCSYKTHPTIKTQNYTELEKQIVTNSVRLKKMFCALGSSKEVEQ